ncbi:hypothetical protein ACFPRL_04995 [Pseudoclavibacter helvolus]
MRRGRPRASSGRGLPGGRSRRSFAPAHRSGRDRSYGSHRCRRGNRPRRPTWRARQSGRP